jgi:fucose permease
MVTTMEKSDVPVIVRSNSSDIDANTIILPYTMDHKQEVIHDDASASTVCDATMSAPIPATEKDESPRAQLRRNIFPILQCYFTVALMGIQDGNFGIILPHLKLYYGASDSLISILFLIQAAGFFVMAFSNGYIVSKITQKGALYLGCSMMLVAYIILLFGFPFPVVCVIMVILGGGLSLLNAGCNVFIITAPYTTTVLNLLHGKLVMKLRLSIYATIC